MKTYTVTQVPDVQSHMGKYNTCYGQIASNQIRDRWLKTTVEAEKIALKRHSPLQYILLKYFPRLHDTSICIASLSSRSLTLDWSIRYDSVELFSSHLDVGKGLSTEKLKNIKRPTHNFEIIVSESISAFISILSTLAYSPLLSLKNLP